MTAVENAELCVVCETSDEAEIVAGREPRGCLWLRKRKDVADAAAQPPHVTEWKRTETDYEAMQRGCPPYLESSTPAPVYSVTS
ncbi:hypothetical protein HY411_00240 [Candidatus Gottesmanbacteria bacterium]|nr:hypothetical protein [Candidatus Gottesmanbacteria bacterium]